MLNSKFKPLIIGLVTLGALDMIGIVTIHRIVIIHTGFVPHRRAPYNES